jgi:hypothetical protein
VTDFARERERLVGELPASVESFGEHELGREVGEEPGAVGTKP